MKKKTYVEFFGLSGAGKSTIRKALAEELKDNGVLSVEKLFWYDSWICRYIFPVIGNFKKSMLLIGFWFKNRDLLPGMRNGTGKPKGMLISTIRNLWDCVNGSSLSDCIKNSLVVSYVLSRNGRLSFLNEGPLYMVYRFSGQERYERFSRLLNIDPEDEIIFVFVDTSPECSYERWKKSKKRVSRIRRYHKTLGRYEKAHKKKKDVYVFLTEEERKRNIKRMIWVNGEEPVRVNVEAIKKGLGYGERRADLEEKPEDRKAGVQ